MNPGDDGTTMTEEEMFDEEYIGAMEGVCEAVEHWSGMDASQVELSALKQGGVKVEEALDRWLAIRERNRARRERGE